jgi:AmmeMemoRadiSam system protein B
MTVRKPAVAGTFYPLGKKELKTMIEQYLSEAKDVQIGGRLRALVEPHAGYMYSGPVAAYGYRLLASRPQGISKVLMLGPSHYAGFFGLCEGGFDSWETPLGSVKAESILPKLDPIAKKLFATYPNAHAPEHCLEVQLPFLQTALAPGFSIEPLLCGDLEPEQAARALAPLIDDKTLVLASSDLSHYLPYPIAVRTDRIANESVPSLDIARFETAGDACGKFPILILMHLAKMKGWKGTLLDYRNSGDTAGDKSQVVGYGCYAFYGK